MAKTCRTCGNEKELDEFYKHPGGKDGRDTRCKECSGKASKSSRQGLEARYKALHADGKKPEGLFRCGSCQTDKSTDEFYVSRSTKTGLTYQCRVCMDARSEKGRQKPESKMKAREGHLRRKFGMTHQEYEAKLASQGGGCAICGTTVPGGRGKWFHVDHDHKTGKARGLLCNKCNGALGLVNDNPRILQGMIDYVARHN
jgi:hypothetical protein